MTPLSLNEEPLRFSMYGQFVELAFFNRLSKLKLDTYKLDTSARPITGYYNTPPLSSKPVFNLTYDSFDNNAADAGLVAVPGMLHIVNTIEEFKTLDKTQLLKEWYHDFPDAIFHFYCFADLKKFKFYYMTAVPTPKARWVVVLSALVESVEPVDVEVRTVAELFGTKDGVAYYVDACTGPLPAFYLKRFLDTDAPSTVVVIKPESRVEYKINPTNVSAEIVGWEINPSGKRLVNIADMGNLIDPLQLVEQAVDLNRKLMKWRIAPDIDLDIISKQKVLLLGSGTLGTYVARALLAWGVTNITFVDNGRVSYLNPVRQSLFTYDDSVSDNGKGVPKAQAAADGLRKVYPKTNTTGVLLNVPMIGHEASKADYDALCKLITDHDAIFLLMDLRELRWLPTVVAKAANKTVINAALGFDLYLVMRHGSTKNHLGCYYCNDVVAPSDSLTDRTLDQMCTVTRPGGALIALALAVELFVSLLQNDEGNDAGVDEGTTLFGVPHQIRGFLHLFEQHKFVAPEFPQCLACSVPVIENYNLEGWEFIRQCLSSTEYVEQVSGLAEIKQQAEAASEKLIADMEDADLDDEWFD